MFACVGGMFARVWVYSNHGDQSRVREVVWQHVVPFLSFYGLGFACNRIDAGSIVSLVVTKQVPCAWHEACEADQEWGAS